MSDLKTSRIELKPVESSDLPILHKWRNEFRFLNLFSLGRNLVSLEEFAKEHQKDTERERRMQFMVMLREKNLPIGTIYTLNLNQIDGYVFIGTYIDEQHERMGYGAEAVALLVHYLFKFFPIHKIYFEVFAYNKLSLSTLRNAEFVEEGHFKEHRFIDGARYDVIRFAACRSSLKKLNCLLKKFQNRRREIRDELSTTVNKQQKGGGQNGL